MRRREFITLISGATASWPLAVRAQQPERMRLIGVLMSYAQSDPHSQAMVAAFRDGLAKLGWREGKNLRIEFRWGGGDAERFKALARELVSLRPDVMLCQGTVATGLLVRETQAIPIVFVNVADPIGSGFVGNLAHPGGNITGFMMDISTQGGKWVESLKKLVPTTARVVLLSNQETGPPLRFVMPSIEAAASFLAVAVSTAPVHAKDEIEGVIAAQAREPGGGLIVVPSAFGTVNRDLIIALTAQYRLPAIYFDRIFYESGGLIAYSPDFTEQYGPAAGYVDRVLKGAKPADLPVQAPTRFELLINLKTAKALGLTVPPAILATADEVIE